jgi:diguanylate cyclase (GGDEF)-like protein
MGKYITFRLTRYFSFLSLVLIVAAGLTLGWSARDQATKQMSEMAQHHNEAMGQVFINALWPHFSPLTESAKSLSSEELRQEVVRLNLHPQVATLMHQSHIVKVKVYNREGLTVFSSDPKQIGESKLGNVGFQSGLAGRTASELTHRNQFDSFEGVQADLDVISSYLPVRDDAQIVAVMELYQDVTPFVQELNQVLIDVVLVGACVMVLLYLAQLMVVRYAQRLLLAQEDQLLQSNRELDARVAGRTAELATSNAQLQAEVAERQRAEVRLDHLAHHDPLTHLPNRLLFVEHLQRSIANAERHMRQIAVLFIDLDRFKEVNDTLGHTIGDELLVEIAKRLSGHIRTGDLLSRLGGDEFVCVLENVDSLFEAANVAEKLNARIAGPIELRNHSLQISASIGIAIYPQDGADTDNLLRAADTAMYQAKKMGRNTHHFYTPEMTQHARERVAMERLLRQAIANNELEVHYQIKMTAGDAPQPCGAEALLRWNNPELGSVPPVRFIPIAEETGFIVELGRWVLRTACQQAALWRTQGLVIPKMSVNLSVRQLERADILETVQRALVDSGLPAQALELEITESVIMNADDAISALERLTTLGIHLSVDDFGTGYSSLAYLKLLPIDTLKIDRSFVIGIGDNRGDESIIRAVIGMAQSLHLHTVAEGVETELQRAFLQKEGCEQMQGYLFGKPMAAGAFAERWKQLTLPAREASASA